MRLFKLSVLLLIVWPSAAPCLSAAAGRAAAVQRSRAGGPVKSVTPRQLQRLIAGGGEVAVVDVRTPSDYEASQTKIKGALRIAPGDLEWRLNELSRKKPVVLYCACPGDQTSFRLAGRLKEYGYKEVMVLKGGWAGWVQAAGQQEPK